MLYKKSRTKEMIHNQKELHVIVSETLSDMAQIVGRTLGPGGRCVLIDREELQPLITKDGVTVIKSLGIGNVSKNIVLDAAKEIAIGTAKEAGDGTTTAIIVANALVEKGLAFLANQQQYNPQRLINELSSAYADVVVPFLKKYAIPVSSVEELKNVALISSNGDKRIAEAVVEAVELAGEDGKVLIHEGDGDIVEVKHANGFIVTTGLKDLGQIGPAFINDKSGQQVKMDSGHVFLYDGSLNDLSVPAKIQDAIADPATGATDGLPIIVFAHSFADNVLDKFAKITKSGLIVLPVKTPRSGLPNGASIFLQDLAAYTEAIVYDPGNMDSICREGFGSFDSALVNMYEAFIINDEPNEELVDARVLELKAYMNQAFGELDKQHLRAAIAKLTGGISSIVVGGTSDLEIREKKDRVEDAVEAVRSAVEEGIIPGGGTTMIKLRHVLINHPDRKKSWSILEDALLQPIRLILDNCGAYTEDELTSIIPMIECTEGLPTVVFDANNYTQVDPLVSGIIEPAKVCRVAINNAISVASLLMTLGGIVVRPSNESLEMQKEMAEASFKSMMDAAGQQ